MQLAGERGRVQADLPPQVPLAVPVPVVVDSESDSEVLPALAPLAGALARDLYFTPKSQAQHNECVCSCCVVVAILYCQETKPPSRARSGCEVTVVHCQWPAKAEC